MTSYDLDTWWVIYGVFIGANLESGTHFALNNVPVTHSCNERNEPRKRLISFETLRDLDSEATIYGSLPPHCVRIIRERHTD